MTLTYHSVLNQIFYPYKKFDSASIVELEKWMLFATTLHSDASVSPEIENMDHFIEVSAISTQQHPPGTREDYSSVSSRLHVTQNGTKLDAPKDGRGLESASLILMKGLESVQNPSDFLEAGFGRPGVPPISTKSSKQNTSLFFPKQQDTLFWCAYAIFHGEAGYYVIGNRYKNTEMAEKQKIIDSVRSIKKAYVKMSNVRVQEIMSELMLDKKTNWNTFMAICAYYKFKALVVRGKTYMEFSPNIEDSMGTFLFNKNKDGHISVDLEAISKEKEEEIRGTHLQIDCVENKPLRAASYYKMDELHQMARTLELDFGDAKLKKMELYEKIIEHC
jgi:hypothetical protein